MSSAKARVAFLWHMHQPYYRDLVTGKSSLPWVRLHAVKDYHAMAAVIKRFPQMKATFNFVPSLIKQILEYTEEGLRDDFWDATATRAADLDSLGRTFILRNFFMTNWNLIIKPSPRYAELLEKRGYHPQDKELERAAVLFSTQDFLDLQVWFNLSWFHPLQVQEDSTLDGFFKKGRNFSEADKAYILRKQLEIMRQVLPAYRELLESGQVELSTSPFYHPILPLLVNVENARESMPGLELPSPPFSRPDDASLQLSRAVESHERFFGRKPTGLWPAEGSVSEDMIPLVMQNGFSWMASDEDILYRSLGLEFSRPISEEQRCDLLYKPYRLDRGHLTLSMVFRDHLLSDAISFTYGHWEPKAAAADLLGRIEGIVSRCRGKVRSPLITIILDGENPWEYYLDQGHTFLRDLYGGFGHSERIVPVTISEAVEDIKTASNIPRLFAGSWINHNFQIWIGHQEDRRAWELLAKARASLDAMPLEKEADGARAKALEEILIAEGSDWCWWYGDENSSGNDEAFDELYRKHLKNVYTLAGREIPDEFKVTIFSGKKVIVPITRIYSFIHPVIDGRVTNYFEWLAAGEYPIDRHGATMHRAECKLSAVLFGFNRTTLFIRIDPAMKMMANALDRYTFAIHFLRPRKARLEASPGRDGGLAVDLLIEGQKPGQAGGGWQAAFKDVLEVGLTFELFGAGIGERIDFFVSLLKDGREIGHWPNQGFLSVIVPNEDFEEKLWSI